MNARVALIGTFLAAALATGALLSRTVIIDGALWAYQAKQMLMMSPALYSSLDAFYHPGGPVLEASILFRALPLSTMGALIAGLALLFGLIIACTGFVAYLLRGDLFWSAALCVILVLDPSSFISTPPSMIAGLLAVLLALLTLLVREQGSSRSAIAWAIAAGALSATRIEIGGLAFLVFFPLLARRWNIRRSIEIAAITFGSFFVFDPFMWHTPVAQVTGLLRFMLQHYNGLGDFGTEALSIHEVLIHAPLGIFALAATVLAILLGKRFRAVLPRDYLVSLLILTVILFAVVGAAAYQTARYLMPAFLIAESLLPLYIFALSPRRSIQGALLAVLVFAQAASYWVLRVS